MNFAAIIVLYNKFIGESSTYIKLKEYNQNISFIIVDNSTSDYNNEKFCNDNNLKYLSMNGNVGLSKAYNHAFDYVKNTDADFAILFDDDSNTDVNYFDELIKKVEDTKDFSAVYAPLIYDSNGTLHGPVAHCNINIFKQIHNKLSPLDLDFIEKLQEKNELNAINSGLVIPRNIFETYRYDEKIFLDCVDWKFCDDMQKQGVMIYKFDGVLHQDFHFNSSEYEISPGQHARLILRKKDLWNYSKAKYFVYLTYVIFLAIYNTKNFRYLKYYFISK